jgi:hypothetical protein
VVILHQPFWTEKRNSHSGFGFSGGEADVVIIGGGLRGLATMYFLSSQNMHCTLLERNTVGGKESLRNIGAVCAIPDCSPNMFEENAIIDRIKFAESNREMLSLLVTEMGIDVDLVCNGGLHLAANDTQAAQLSVLQGLLVKNGFVCDELDGKQITDLVGGSQFEAGLYYPGEATINPSKLIDLYLSLLKVFTNNTLTEGFNVGHIEETAEGVTVTSDRGTVINARAVVICADECQHFYYGDKSNRSDKQDEAALELPNGAELGTLCFATQKIDKIAGKTPMSARTVTGIQAWTIHDGRIIYAFRHRKTTGDNYGYDEDDIRKSQKFLNQYVPVSKGHFHQEYIWTSTYRQPGNLLPHIGLASGKKRIVLNVDYGYNVLDFFLAGSETASKCVKTILENEPAGGADSAEPASN